MDQFNHAKRILKQQIRRTARQAHEAAGGTARVNVTGTRNVVVSDTVGGRDSVNATSSRQSVRIRQQDGETIEETVSTTEVASPSVAERRERTVRTERTGPTTKEGTADDE